MEGREWLYIQNLNVGITWPGPPGLERSASGSGTSLSGRLIGGPGVRTGTPAV
ncbi:hypothetical protein PGTUg99_007546 [Puccinia graminis f. sp. tritici]|uniref:Uncharacterized protein n=1 Tax=Puccinia graminis f. sp. tritici TaxID=56615 RepID=A0A5B0Q0V4_PUCGR|nr:hypothetical protein PGTUg99_007546 [Puccinia graminis f. sp. tritici]